MSEEAEEHWWLVASLPPSRPATKGGLDLRALRHASFLLAPTSARGRMRRP